MTTAPELTKTCDYCGQVYTKSPAESQARWKLRRFCSPACYQQMRVESALRFPPPRLVDWLAIDLDPLLTLALGYVLAKALVW
jgi:hypothetical protein